MSDITLPKTTAAASKTDAAKGAEIKAARAAGEDFESFFLTQSMESMFAGMQTNSMFGGGSGETTYRSLLFQEYGKIAARSGGVGVADAVQREVLRAQESRSNDGR